MVCDLLILLCDIAKNVGIQYSGPKLEDYGLLRAVCMLQRSTASTQLGKKWKAEHAFKASAFFYLPRLKLWSDEGRGYGHG